MATDRTVRVRLLLPLFMVASVATPIVATAAQDLSADDVQTFLKKYCLECHQGIKPKAKLDLARFDTIESLIAEPKIWNKVLVRVGDDEMPPEESDAPTSELRGQFVAWIERTLRSAACDDGISPGPAPIRRLNRDEYAATVRDLLDIHFNAGHALPADGAGGEGFDNAAETLFLSPIHAEKYLEAAKEALDYAIGDPRASQRFLIARPSDEISPTDAARTVLETFVPRAFRRPALEGEVEPYLALFQNARQRNEPFDQAVLFALQGVLISPNFLFRFEEPNPAPGPRRIDDYVLATRLSYFLWGSMPDNELFELAAAGRLNQVGTLREQVVRMLSDGKAREFAQRFVEQWLGTRELGRDIRPDRTIHRSYNNELEAAIKYEPVLFFQEILAKDLSLLNLLDADFTFLSTKLRRHYGLDIKGTSQQPKRFDLPEGSHRGGVLSMAAVLAVSSYPNRTSPVLRGKWVLESLLGTPPPAPPPNVPELEEPDEDDEPKTLRERLLIHRQNPTCATCHDRIDPIGFGLENYDAVGRWRTEDAGQPIDSTGQLPGGLAFEGPDGLKAMLLERKDAFIRHLTTKMLGYALGRGLTIEDYCTVDTVVDRLKRDEYGSHTLIIEIVRSVPFRYQSGTDPTAAVPRSRAPNLEDFP